MKFLLIAALCIGAAIAEVSHEEQLKHEHELAELCKEKGVFPNPHDPEGRTFIRCELEPIELSCDEGFKFDAEKLMCVEIPKPKPDVDMDKVKWNEVLSCPAGVEDKYFRNPYDCHRFFRCYKQGHFERLDVGACLPSMIFDEVLETCLPIEQFKSYYGHECHALPLPDDHHEHQNPDPEPNPDKGDQNGDEHNHQENPEPEPEKKPSLADILKELKDLFGRH